MKPLQAVEALATISDTNPHAGGWRPVAEKSSFAVTLKWAAGTPTGGTLKLQSTEVTPPGANDGADLLGTVAIPATLGGEVSLSLGSCPFAHVRAVVTLTGGAMTTPNLHYTSKS